MCHYPVNDPVPFPVPVPVPDTRGTGTGRGTGTANGDEHAYLPRVDAVAIFLRGNRTCRRAGETSAQGGPQIGRRQEGSGPGQARGKGTGARAPDLRLLRM